jgi:PAS domain S-box-containing protein
MTDQPTTKVPPSNELTELRQTVVSLRQQVAELETLVMRGQQAEEQLHSSEERFRQFVLSISDHIYVTEINDRGQHFNRYVSPHAETLTGYATANMMADWSFWPLNIIHPDDRMAAALQATHLGQGQNSEMEYRLVRADGRIIWVRDSARVEAAGDSKVVYGVVADITERKHRETALAKLLELSRALVTYHDPTLLLDQAIKAATAMAPGADRGSLQLLDEDGETLRTVAISTPGEALGQTLTFRPGLGIAGHALANNQTISVPDVLADDRFVHSSLPLRFRSLLVAPLVVKGRLLGTLSLSSQKINAFSAADETFAQLIADQVAAALENARLFTSYLQAEKLRKAYQFLQATIDALASHIAILDERGVIIAVNARWRLYATANGYTDQDCGLGENYLEICDTASGDYAEEAPIVAEGIRQVMAGRRNQFYLEYPAHNPLEQQWFGVRVTRFQNEGATWIVITHEDVTERQIAEEALRASEEKYRNLTHHLPVGVYRDMPGGQLSYANPALVAILGYGSVEEVLQISIRDAFDDPAERLRQLEACRISSDIAYNEIKLRTQNGDQIWVRDIARVFLDETGEIAYVDGIIQDITESKEAARALQASESRFRSLVQNSSDIIILLAADGSILYISPPIERILGYHPRQMVGQNLLDYIYPEDLTKVQTQFNNLIHHAENNNSPIEFRLHRATDRWIWMEAVGNNLLDDPNVKGIVINGRDISRRKQVEEQLHLLAAAIGSAQEGILITDIQPPAQEPSIVFVNKGLCQMSGYTQEELLGQTPRIFEGPKTDPSLLARLKGTLAQGQSFNGETINYRRDGSEYYVAWHISPVFNSVGQVTHYVSIQRDVTKIKQLETQFLQAQKMDAVGRLAGGVAHDFNNLLTVIKGYGDLLLMRLGESHPLRSYAEQVKKAADHAASMTRQLLVFSRQEMAQPETIDLNVVVGDIEKMLRRLIGEDIELETTLDPALGLVKVNPGQLEQVIMNLIVNARDAMPYGGQVSIRTSNEILTDTTHLQPMGIKPGKYATLTIMDTGLGMDEDTITHIFEPFFTTKEQGKGTGLGLSTVYAIVSQSNGGLQVLSQPGQGTTFCIYLPAMTDNQASANGQVSQELSPESDKGTETILVVEDEEAVRELAKLVLDEQGYQVLEAKHGDQALQICTRWEGPLHLLLADVVVPGGMSSRELAERLKDLSPKTKILYMSGYTDDVIGRHGVQDADINFLQKPFTPAMLKSKVRETLDATE